MEFRCKIWANLLLEIDLNQNRSFENIYFYATIYRIDQGIRNLQENDFSCFESLITFEKKPDRIYYL
jgi:hypothetical protein